MAPANWYRRVFVLHDMISGNRSSGWLPCASVAHPAGQSRCLSPRAEFAHLQQEQTRTAYIYLHDSGVACLFDYREKFC